MIYLASPYTHSSEEIMESRYKQATDYCISHSSPIVHIVSPIAHWHYIAKWKNLPRDSDHWREWDQALLEKCDALWVLMLSGWWESEGIRREIEFASSKGIPVSFKEPEDV